MNFCKLIGSRLPAGFTLGLAVVLGIFGCNAFSERNGGYRGPGQIQSWPTPSWSEAFVYKSAHYTVRTNTSPDTANHIGRFMEKALSGYRSVVGDPVESLPRFFINVFASCEEYEKVVRHLGMPPGITTGLYSPVPPGAIYLSYAKCLKDPPAVTLLHEGLHQFLHKTASFRVPEEALNTLPPEKHVLMSVPLWLSEGLADYMEGSVMSEDRINIGSINRPRLVYLQKLIRSGKCPPLAEVLSRRYGEPFLAGDYAVAWGIVYTLRHAPRANVQAERRKQLESYISACRQAFYKNPDAEFARDFLRNGKPLEDFNHQWAAYIARNSLKAFEQIIVSQGSTLDAWEQDWRARILSLDSNDPFGGLPHTSIAG